jgi:hypothetical protein
MRIAPSFDSAATLAFRFAERLIVVPVLFFTRESDVGLVAA